MHRNTNIIQELETAVILANSTSDNKKRLENIIHACRKLLEYYSHLLQQSQENPMIIVLFQTIYNKTKQFMEEGHVLSSFQNRIICDLNFSCQATTINQCWGNCRKSLNIRCKRPLSNNSSFLCWQHLDRQRDLLKILSQVLGKDVATLVVRYMLSKRS